jgi:hypothetical protein
MSSSPSLASHFLSHLRPEARSHASPSALERVLGEVLARAREDVREGTRARLAERLRLSPSEVHSVLRAEADQWEQTLSGLLATYP